MNTVLTDLKKVIAEYGLRDVIKTDESGQFSCPILAELKYDQ